MSPRHLGALNEEFRGLRVQGICVLEVDCSLEVREQGFSLETTHKALIVTTKRMVILLGSLYSPIVARLPGSQTGLN